MTLEAIMDEFDIESTKAFREREDIYRLTPGMRVGRKHPRTGEWICSHVVDVKAIECVLEGATCNVQGGKILRRLTDPLMAWEEDYMIDFSSPPTQGCVLEMAQEDHGVSAAFVSYSEGVWHVMGLQEESDPVLLGRGDTRREALVDALLAAPPKES